MKRNSIYDVLGLERKFSVLSCYTRSMAQAADKYADMLLVGDSLGMVIYGLESTLQVTMDMMINHGRAVVKASSRAPVLVDMPFASYEASPERAFKAAAKIMAKTGADAVKIEGAEEMATTVQFLTERGIPVVGHIGMMPQHYKIYGGFKAQSGAEKMLQTANALAGAGALALFVECVKQEDADRLVAGCQVPIIGIGASKACAGQVLVGHDIAGLGSGQAPRFVKKYASLQEQMAQAMCDFHADVVSGQFPEDKHLY